VKESVAHFEDETTKQGQGQYARALYYKALLSSEDGKRRAHKQARRALEDACEDFGLSEPREGDLSPRDFEDILELGYC
jgi:hypothetical protein